MQAVNECLLKFILDSLPGKTPSACVSFTVMMHGCLCVCEWVCVCLSLPHNFTVSLGLTINPASFIVTTRPINQYDARRGDRPPVSCKQKPFLSKDLFLVKSKQGVWTVLHAEEQLWVLYRLILMQKFHDWLLIVPGTATICLSSCFKLMMSLQSWMSSILKR